MQEALDKNGTQSQVALYEKMKKEFADSNSIDTEDLIEIHCKSAEGIYSKTQRLQKAKRNSSK